MYIDILLCRARPWGIGYARLGARLIRSHRRRANSERCYVFVGGVRLGVWGVVLVVCVSVRGGVLCRCVCVCDVLKCSHAQLSPPESPFSARGGYRQLRAQRLFGFRCEALSKDQEPTC